jgi:hypothetical protein
MSKKKKPPMPAGANVEKGPDKADIQSREDRSALVKTKATQSSIWAAQQSLQDAGNKLIAAGLNLTAADVDHANALKTVEITRTAVETRIVEWNVVYDLYVSMARSFATTPGDLAGLALDTLERHVYTLAEPLSIAAKLDVKADLIRIHVKLPKGLRACEIEVSTDGTTFHRLVGNGVTREIPQPAPGTYTIRAAAVRAGEQSAFIQPVQVVVK